MVAGSLEITPIARNDFFNTVGNVPIGAGSPIDGLAANDIDPDGGTLTITELQGSPGDPNFPFIAGSTNNLGFIQVERATGRFFYDPPAEVDPVWWTSWSPSSTAA